LSERALRFVAWQSEHENGYEDRDQYRGAHENEDQPTVVAEARVASRPLRLDRWCRRWCRNAKRITLGVRGCLVGLLLRRLGCVVPTALLLLVVRHRIGFQYVREVLPVNRD